MTETQKNVAPKHNLEQGLLILKPPYIYKIIEHF